MVEPIMTEPTGSQAREIALTLISLARHPKLVPAAGNLCREDNATADREATLALAAAAVYLADTLNGRDQPVVTDEEPMRA